MSNGLNSSAPYITICRVRESDGTGSYMTAFSEDDVDHQEAEAMLRELLANPEFTAELERCYRVENTAVAITLWASEGDEDRMRFAFAAMEIFHKGGAKVA